MISHTIQKLQGCLQKRTYKTLALFAKTTQLRLSISNVSQSFTEPFKTPSWKNTNSAKLGKVVWYLCDNFQNLSLCFRYIHLLLLQLPLLAAAYARHVALHQNVHTSIIAWPLQGFWHHVLSITWDSCLLSNTVRATAMYCAYCVVLYAFPPMQ